MAAIGAAFADGVAGYKTQILRQNSTQRQRLLPEPITTQSGTQNAATSTAQTDNGANEEQREFVRVSSSIGRAASAGQLSRQEAIDIYKQIARYL